MSGDGLKPKGLGVSPEVHAYLIEHGAPPDAIERELIAETQALGDVSIMQIAAEQAAFLRWLAVTIGAQRAIEIGTFTGYSALAIARGLPADGELVCCDVSEEWTSIGRRAWERAGVAGKIDLRLAPALETLAELQADAAQADAFDFAFVDAVKSEYGEYLDALAHLVRPGGVIVVDNVLFFGMVVDPDTDNEMARAIQAFNARTARDERFDRVMIPVADGLTLLRRR